MNTLTLNQHPLLPANWHDLKNLQSAWFYSMVGNLALMVFCLVAQQFDERTLFDVSVWSKPFKFALSLAVYFGTLLWMWQFVPTSFRHSKAGAWLVGIPTFMGFFEMAYIAYQAALGEASHFNFTSNFHATMYSLMGFGATCMVVILGWLAIVIGRQNSMRQPLILSIVLGLVLTLVLGGGFGGYMGSAGGHWVNAPATDANSVAFFNWTRNGGDLRVAHFFGMHAMQLIPLFAMLLPQKTNNNLKLSLIVTFACAFSAFTTMTFVQAINAQPFMA